PPAGSPPPPSSSSSSKRRISLPNGSPATKKHKLQRKASVVGSHPLRQTSFPPEEDPSQGPANHEEEDDEDRGDDYGTTSLLADGMLGGFGEDDERKQRLALLVEHFDNDQLARYEAYRRSNLNKAAVKKITNQTLSQSVTANVGTVIGGFAKVYVCDIVQSALEIQNEWGDKGPLLPDHLREAARRYRMERQGAVGNRYLGGMHNGPGPGLGADTFGGGVTRLFR
ncbi:hTAFII28-like protein conserved region-domain-containing protein, partial [Tirmania nivea]